MVEMARACAARFGDGAAEGVPGAPSESLRACLREGMRELIFAEARRQGWTADEAELQRIFTLDIGLNADGLAAWLSGQR
jgi:hypothetical protein